MRAGRVEAVTERGGGDMHKWGVEGWRDTRRGGAKLRRAVTSEAANAVAVLTVLKSLLEGRSSGANQHFWHPPIRRSRIDLDRGARTLDCDPAGRGVRASRAPEQCGSPGRCSWWGW